MDETVNQGITEATETTEATAERTFTQAELDQIVGERLARERTKYADYAVIKEKAARLDSLEEAQKSELEKATERATAAEAELATLKREREIRAAREKVSKETGVPVSLLTGDTEEECKALAEAINEYAGPTVRDHGELRNQPRGENRDKFAAAVSELL